MIGFHAAAIVPETNRIMPSHEAHCDFAYMPEQLFDLAADVECYPEFLPWWIAARVRRREGNTYYTDQVVGFGAIRQRFASKTVLQRPERIDVTSSDWKFRRFHLTWLFDPLPDKGCRATLAVDLKLRSNLAQDLFRGAIIATVGSIMSAFEARAHRQYDSPATPRLTARNSGSNDPIV
jgi:coenzyme Q-binding protein COQ10